MTTKTTKRAPAKRKVTPKTTTRKKTAPSDPIRPLALAAAQLAIEKKATNIKLIDLRAITAITDYFVIASGSSEIQVKAIADHILTEMRKHGLTPWKSEGWDARQWIIIDFVDLVVHIFLESAREFYNLERLWADAPTEVIEDQLLKPKRTRSAKAK
jgi:ribosome-associated protein